MTSHFNIYGGNKRKDRPNGGFYVKVEDFSKTLDSSGGLNPNCQQGGVAVVQSGMARRMTPEECEALQGFRRGWTKVGEATPDGPRFRAIGNSMAVPALLWIGSRVGISRFP